MSGAESLREKSILHGLWSVSGHQGVIDTAASAGPDFIVVDTQHGLDLGQVDASIFTVMANYGVPGLVRVESLDLGRIGRALDLRGETIGEVAPDGDLLLEIGVRDGRLRRRGRSQDRKPDDR